MPNAKAKLLLCSSFSKHLTKRQDYEKEQTEIKTYYQQVAL